MNDLIKGIKWIFSPIVEVFHKFTSNHFFNGLFSYTTWKFLEAHEANRILSNVMMYFSIVAFSLYILERVFGINTPLIKVGRVFKVFRNSKIFENPKLIEDNIELTVKESKRLYLKGRKPMKKLFNWLWANKNTTLGLLATIIIAVDEVLNLSAKLDLPDEWQYTVSAIVFVLIVNAVRGRGFEWVEIWQQIKDSKTIAKEERKALKQLEKDKIELEKLERLEKLKQQINATPNQPAQTDHNNQARQRL